MSVAPISPKPEVKIQKKLHVENTEVTCTEERINSK